MAKKQNFVGRPLKLTPKIIETICNALEIGASYDIAARHAQVSYVTFNNWRNSARLILETVEKRLEAGEDGDSVIQSLNDEQQLYLEFLYAIEEAVAKLGIESLRTIYTASTQDASWAAWLLQRRFPTEYGNRASDQIGVSVSSKGGGESNDTIIRVQYIKGDYTPPPLNAGTVDSDEDS